MLVGKTYFMSSFFPPDFQFCGTVHFTKEVHRVPGPHPQHLRGLLASRVGAKGGRGRGADERRGGVGMVAGRRRATLLLSRGGGKMA